MSSVTCPICQNDDFDYLGCKCTLKIDYASDNRHYMCDICGKFTFTDEAYEDMTAKVSKKKEIFPRAQRSLVSHLFKTQTRDYPKDRILIKTVDLNEKIFKRKGRPHIHVQMKNGIVFIGGEFERTGDSLKFLPVDIHSIIGSLNRIKAIELFAQLKERRYVEFEMNKIGTRWEPYKISITIEGSEYYEILMNSQLNKDSRQELTEEVAFENDALGLTQLSKFYGPKTNFAPETSSISKVLLY